MYDLCMQLFVETCGKHYFSSSWSRECSCTRLSYTFFDALLVFLCSLNLGLVNYLFVCLRLLVRMLIITEIINHRSYSYILAV